MEADLLGQDVCKVDVDAGEAFVLVRDDEGRDAGGADANALTAEGTEVAVIQPLACKGKKCAFRDISF